MSDAVCPVCGAAQDQSLLCSSCCDRLERSLGDVRWIVTELNTTLSKQAKIGTPAKGGLAREKNPVHYGAMEAADTLGNVLGTWARDIQESGYYRSPYLAAACLLSNIDAIRRHPAVVELMDEITDAVEQARRVVDRPADKAYLGRCTTAFLDEEDQTVTCYTELWIRPEQTEATCRVCGEEYVVLDRRKWLVEQAAEMVVTAKQASLYLSDVGQLDVSETSIRNWVGRGKVALRPGLSTQRQFELGALMDYIGKRQAETQSQQVAELSLAV